MSLIQLAYTSEAADGFGLEDLRDVLAKSKRNNRRDGLTGFLSFDAPLFIQCLEGQRDMVLRYLDRIEADPRHTGLLVLEMRNIDAREFADWSMELVCLDDVAREMVREVWERPANGVSATMAEDRLARLIRGVSPATVPTTEVGAL